MYEPLPESPVRRTRVAYVFLDLADGGAQRLTLAAARHLDRTRFDASVLCLRGGGALTADAVAQGIPVHSLGRLRRRLDGRAVAVTARWLARAGIDVAHVQLYSRASPYARLAARMAHVPVVVAHEWCRPCAPARTRQLADRLLRPGTRFVATSQSLAFDLIADGVPSEDVTVVHSGIDTDAFAPRDREASRAALGLDPARPTCLVPARLHPMKGHVDLMAALPLVLRQVPGLLTLCAGDGPLRRVLPALASSSGLGEAIVFLGRRSDIPTLIGASDLVVLPSRIEGIPSAMLEALSGRRAVVASAVGGVPEVLGEGVGGWQVPPREPNALAQALCDALQHPAQAARRARAGREVVLARFRAEQTARHLEALYDAWLAQSDPARRLPTTPLDDGAARGR